MASEYPNINPFYLQYYPLDEDADAEAMHIFDTLGFEGDVWSFSEMNSDGLYTATAPFGPSIAEANPITPFAAMLNDSKATGSPLYDGTQLEASSRLAEQAIASVEGRSTEVPWTMDMPSRPSPRAVEQSKGALNWDRYKTFIREFYINQNKPLKELMLALKKDGFCATKAQYEKQLKKWGLRKNLSHTDWKAIRKRMERQDVAVFVDGANISEKNIQRRAKRCYFTTLEVLELSQRAKTPERVVLIPKSYLPYIKTKQIPWMFFCAQVEQKVRESIIFAIPTSIRENILPSLAMHHYSSCGIATQKTIRLLSAVVPTALDSNSEILELMRIICGPEGSESTWAFLKLIVYLLSNHLLRSKYSTSDKYSLEQDWEDIVSNEILKWFQMGTNHRILKMVLDDLTPTVEAFSEPVFCSAVRTGDIQIITRFLDAGLSTDTYHWDGLSLLELASASGNYQVAKLLLSAGACINTKRGTRPLEHAIPGKHPHITELLLQYHPELDYIPLQNQKNPLQAAAFINDVKMVGFLVEQGVDVNTPAGPGLGRTALQWAATSGNKEIIDILVKSGANINGDPALPIQYIDTSEKYGVTALVAAVLQGNQEVVQLFLGLGADIDDDRGQWTALETAVRIDDSDMVQLLLDAGADPRVGAPLLSAVRNGNYGFISTLLDLSFDADSDGMINGALRQAVFLNNVDLVHLFLQRGADPNSAIGAVRDTRIMRILVEKGSQSTVNHAVIIALYWSSLTDVQYCISYGADLNGPPAEYYISPYGNVKGTALQAAVHGKYEDTEMVRFLISKGANINAPATEKDSMTALQRAVQRSSKVLVELLLDAGANADDLPAPAWGRTALQQAAHLGNDALIHILLKHGADVNSPPADRGGMSALQAAADNGHFQTVELLLVRGANVNAPPASEYGRTALQAAAEQGHIRIVKLLIQQGADIDAQGSRGGLTGTALELAAVQGRLDMLKLLLVSGAQISGDGQARFDRAVGLAIKYGQAAAAKFLRYHQMQQSQECGQINDQRISEEIIAQLP